jgi:hypothetical protein
MMLLFWPPARRTSMACGSKGDQPRATGLASEVRAPAFISRRVAPRLVAPSD